MTQRLFVGLEIPDELRDRLALLQTGVHGAKWVRPENFHVTLRFIGEIEDGLARDIVHELDQVRLREFDLTLAGAGHFESRRRVRELWVGVEKSDPLTALRDKIDSIVKREVGPDNQRFRPHVTLARFNGAKPETVRHWLSANTLFRAMPFAVERFVLFSSFLGKSAAIYRPEAEYPLVGA